MFYVLLFIQVPTIELIMIGFSFNIPMPIPQPIDFHANVVGNIRHFREQWHHFNKITGLEKIGNDMKLSYMYLMIGQAACGTIKDLANSMTEEERSCPDTVLSKLENRYSMPKNTIKER